MSKEDVVSWHSLINNNKDSIMAMEAIETGLLVQQAVAVAAAITIIVITEDE